MAKKVSFADIRVVSATVLGIIGIFLIICGFTVTGAEQLAKSDQINANLYSGIGLTVIALIFFLWAILRPEAQSEPKAEAETQIG